MSVVHSEAQIRIDSTAVKHTLEYTNLVSCSFRSTNTHRFHCGLAQPGICKPCQSVVYSEAKIRIDSIVFCVFFVASYRASWDWFCRLLEPRPESHQIEPPETGFIDFWSQGQKVIKSSLLGLLLSTSEAKARKSLNRASWDWFSRLLEPRPESHQIEPPGTTFVDFWGQGQKVIKSSLLGLLLSTSGAKQKVIK